MKNIMIVEDEAAIREFEAINLKRVGYNVVEAGSGEEALEIYDADPDAVDIALLAVPARAAQGLAERLYACGVRGFWNFAPVDLYLPEDAVTENVHLDESLEVLSFRILQKAASPMEQQEEDDDGVGRRL